MKSFVIILILLAGQITAMAQTPIINSKINYKDFKELIWLNNANIEDERMTIIEFYLDGNPSCRQIMDSVLIPIHTENPEIQIIIIAYNESQRLNKIAQQYPNINVGIDERGTVFNKYGIKYVPASVLIDENNKIMWQGTLNQTPNLF